MDNVTTVWKPVPLPPRGNPLTNAYLVQIYPTGAGLGARFPLDKASLIIGRGADCDIRLDDPSVSRRHVRIQQMDSDGYCATDLGSSNGVLVNDRLVPLAKLQDGDHIQIGNHIFRFLAGDSVEACYHEEIHRLAIFDGLLGIHNKRYLLEFLERELARSIRHQRPLVLILFDVDRFKDTNDRLGHLGGDATLRELVGRIKGDIRREDLLARYGGDEFAVVLTEATRAGGQMMVDRLRQRVESQPFRYKDQIFPVTISFGLGTVAPEGGGLVSPEDLIRQADLELYRAKQTPPRSA